MHLRSGDIGIVALTRRCVTPKILENIGQPENIEGFEALREEDKRMVRESFDVISKETVPKGVLPANQVESEEGNASQNQHITEVLDANLLVPPSKELNPQVITSVVDVDPLVTPAKEVNPRDITMTEDSEPDIFASTPEPEMPPTLQEEELAAHDNDLMLPESGFTTIYSNLEPIKPLFVNPNDLQSTEDYGNLEPEKATNMQSEEASNMQSHQKSMPPMTTENTFAHSLEEPEPLGTEEAASMFFQQEREHPEHAEQEYLPQEDTSMQTQKKHDHPELEGATSVHEEEMPAEALADVRPQRQKRKPRTVLTETKPLKVNKKIKKINEEDQEFGRPKAKSKKRKA